MHFYVLLMIYQVAVVALQSIQRYGTIREPSNRFAQDIRV